MVNKGWLSSCYSLFCFLSAGAMSIKLGQKGNCSTPTLGNWWDFMFCFHGNKGIINSSIEDQQQRWLFPLLPPLEVIWAPPAVINSMLPIWRTADSNLNTSLISSSVNSITFKASCNKKKKQKNADLSQHRQEQSFPKLSQDITKPYFVFFSSSKSLVRTMLKLCLQS